MVPSLPPLPAATSHGIREAKHAPDSQTPPVRQDPAPPVQPSTAAMRHPPAVPSAPPAVRRPPQPRRTETLPSLHLLDVPGPSQRGKPEEVTIQARFLEQKLREFGVEGEVVQVFPAPSSPCMSLPLLLV